MFIHTTIIYHHTLLLYFNSWLLFDTWWTDEPRFNYWVLLIILWYSTSILDFFLTPDELMNQYSTTIIYHHTTSILLQFLTSFWHLMKWWTNIQLLSFTHYTTSILLQVLTSFWHLMNYNEPIFNYWLVLQFCLRSLALAGKMGTRRQAGNTAAPGDASSSRPWQGAIAKAGLCRVSPPPPNAALSLACRLSD